MDQSTSFRNSVDKAVNGAMSAQLEMTLSAIRALERQMEILSGKVDEILAENK